jgi:nucleoside-diphosphate-sugar epimerase
VETIARITGYEREIGFGKRPYNDKQVMHLQADIGALHDLGFRPSVPFEEGIRKTVAWKKQILHDKHKSGKIQSVSES